MIDFELSERQVALKTQIIDFASGELGKDMSERDKNHVFDQRGWDKCGELQLQGLVIPVEYGGKGLNPLSTAIALEALGYGSKDNGLNFAICAHLLACVVPIWLFGSERQKQLYLPGLCSGRLIASNAMTEAGSGSDAFNIKTFASETKGGFLLNGVKTFCANAPVADLILTYAVTNPEKGFYGGITAFLLEKGKQEFSCETVRKTGLRTCMTGKITIKDTSVPDENILGQPGGGGSIFNTSMEWERICLGAIHLGTMQRLLEDAVKFCKKRKSGGKAIGSYQAISHQLAEMRVNLEAARHLCYHAAAKLSAGEKVAKDAAMAKLFVSETFKAMTVGLNQIYASQAYLEGHEAERALRDAMGSTIYSGTSEVQKNIIAGWMGLR